MTSIIMVWVIGIWLDALLHIYNMVENINTSS